MAAHSFQSSTAAVGLSAVIDVFDQNHLFDEVDNPAVLQLSRLGGQPGFASTRAIEKSTGIRLRRVLKADVTPLDVAIAACHRLQQVTETQLGDFEQILLCHSHTDPLACDRLASEITSELGLPEHSIRSFNHGCTGFLKLLTEGAQLLEGRDQGIRIALLSVETPEFWHDAADRLFCGIVSAGASAAVVEVGRGLPLHTIHSNDFSVPDERRPNPDPLFRKETTDVYDFQGQPCHRSIMRMNAEPVFLNGIELMLEHLRTALLSITPTPGQRVIVAPHQPSGKLLKALVAAARNEFPKVEFLNNLEYYGNTISSSVPTLVSRLTEVLNRNGLQPLRDGDHLILLAAGICMANMSDHMSAGHACLRWQDNALNTAAGSTSENVTIAASR
ncbi:MAG: 3-oxoacyl-[acyl-carrier-protein] synthase III C-terminal domain-containing protein [Fuerstiella sp.]